MWTPLFDALRGRLSSWSEVYLGVYAREAFGADFTACASAPDPFPYANVFGKLVGIAAPLFSEQLGLSCVVIERPDIDILVAAPSGDLDGKRAVVLPLRSPDGDLQGIVVVAVSDEQGLAAVASDLGAIVSRFTGTLEAAIALRSTQEQREAVSRTGLSDRTAFVSALVPDAQGNTPSLLPACVLMAGRAELESAVVFDRITSAVSPRFLEEIAERELLLWSLGKPGALCGLGSAGDPRFLLGRVADSEGVGLFGMTRYLTPAESDDYSPTIAETRAVLQSIQLSLLSDPFRRVVTRNAARDVARAQLRTDALAALTAVESGRDSTDPLRARDDISLWCIAEWRPSAVIADWRPEGDGLVPAFTPVNHREEISPFAADPWLRAAYFEFSDAQRWTAWADIFSALVESSYTAHERQCVYRIASNCVYEVDSNSATRPANATVHGPLLLDGTEVRARWQGQSCCFEIVNGNCALRSTWKVTERYVPLGIFCPPGGVGTRNLDGPELRYPPACSHLLATANRKSLGETHWTPEDPAVSSNHVRTITESISPFGDFWFDAIDALMAVPVGRDKSGPELLLDEWSTGNGARWLLVVPFALVRGATARSAALRLLQLLRPIQDRIITELQGDSRDLDRILVDHLRHDLAVMRTAFNVLSSTVTAGTGGENTHNELSVRRSIRDLDDKLDGLETLCHLRDQSESPSPLDLELLEGSLPLAIMRAASRARKKLARPHADEDRLASSVSYDPPPPSKPLPRPDPLAVLLLENILGNAIYAAEMAILGTDRHNTELVRVFRRDATMIIRNECRPADWEFARRELQTTAPKTRGLSVIVQAGRIGGVRIVPGSNTSGAAELHVIPDRSAL